MRVLLIHGPNLNRLGIRQPEIYGRTTLAEVDQAVTARVHVAGLETVPFQSNHEGALIDFLQQHLSTAAGVIINPGALTHYGLSLRDALAEATCPIIEVHLSNIHARESFRHHSVVAPIATGQIAGLGWRGYLLAAEWLIEKLAETNSSVADD
ncbi:MAG: type II 3-dehydroquinate dehydratase [Planctomycetota bacterium]|nr:type II 3-dehydroquinate dehydratase [Planctomycetota bacterium]